jgi:hypothetical protein
VRPKLSGFFPFGFMPGRVRLMSACGTLRTFALVTIKSAFDPKQTCG